MRDIRVEVILVLRAAHAVVSDPCGGRLLLPNGGKSGAVVDSVAADVVETVATGGEVIEGVLVFGGCQAVASLPGVDLGLDIGEVIEGALVFGGCRAEPGLPGVELGLDGEKEAEGPGKSGDPHRW